MAREDVNIKVSANVAEAIQLWKAMEKGPEGMANALDAMGQKGQKATKGMGDEIIGFVGKWASVGTAVAAVTALINQQYEALKKLREERNAATNTVDEVFNRFQVQAGIKSGPEAERVRTQLLSIIATRKQGPVAGLMAAEQLGSAGASTQDILGGGLDEFLKMITAGNAAGKDVNVPALARSLVLFLEANGKRPNREGMAPTSQAIQQLFAGTNLQVSNLERFAPEAGTIRKMSGLGEQEQLGILSQFLGTMDEGRAAVAFRTGVQRMATAGGQPERVAALKQLGLAPEDIDFKGEDYWTATERLRKGFAGVPGNIQNIVAQKLFGDEGMGFFNVLLQPGGIEESRKRTAMARDPSGMAERLATAESSRAAAAREAETLVAAATYDASKQDTKTVRDRVRALVGMYSRDEMVQAQAMALFDNPLGPDWLYDMTAEGSAQRVMGFLSNSPLRRTAINKQAGKKLSVHQQDQYILEQALGSKPIRILGPDGLDIPTEPAAAGLNQ